MKHAGRIEGTNDNLVFWDIKVLPKSQGADLVLPGGRCPHRWSGYAMPGLLGHWGWGNKIHLSHYVWLYHYTKRHTVGAGPLKLGTPRVPWNSFTWYLCVFMAVRSSVLSDGLHRDWGHALTFRLQCENSKGVFSGIFILLCDT